jgi:hypothetical protein
MKRFMQAFGAVSVALGIVLAFMLIASAFGQGTPFGNGRGAFRGDVYVPSVFSLWFGDNTSTDVRLAKTGAGIIGVSGGLLRTANATQQQLAADFTTAANTNLQTVLTFNLPAAATAQNYSFSCDGSYSIATAAVAVAFGIQAATNAPTNIEAVGLQFTAAATPASATLATLSTTTATNIVSGTPAATATNNIIHLAGTIEEPAATANAINIMVSTATSADVVSVKRGFFCQLY